MFQNTKVSFPYLQNMDDCAYFMDIWISVTFEINDHWHCISQQNKVVSLFLLFKNPCSSDDRDHFLYTLGQILVHAFFQLLVLFDTPKLVDVPLQFLSSPTWFLLPTSAWPFKRNPASGSVQDNPISKSFIQILEKFIFFPNNVLFWV